MRCEHCGGDLVEVDNPMRREVRHRRGVVCPGERTEGDDLPCITADPSTDRGTDVGGPHARSEAVQWGQGADCEHRPEWHCEAHGECRGCECGCDTVNPEADLNSAHWLKFSDKREITGCQCGFEADVDSDCGWGDSVVAHLLEVGAEVGPDVDGWTVHPHAGGGLIVTHDTDADRSVLLSSESLRVGAVLAFIADQPSTEEQADLSLIPADLIVSDPDICSGRPTMRDTRILAETIARELAAGTTWETLREWYPSLPVPSEEGQADER